MTSSRRVLFLPLAVALSAGCTDISSPTLTAVPGAPSLSAHNPTEISRGTEVQAISGLTFPCGDEPFLLNGTIEYRWHTVQRSSGSWMKTQHTQFRSDGEGLYSGRRFTGRSVFNTTQVFAAPDGGAFVYTSIGRGMGIVQGEAQNDFFTVSARWTIDAQGRVVMEHFDVDWDCRGRA